jgi:hypothetical protein
MKTLVLLILVLSSAGCATLASVQGNQAVAADPVALPAIPAAPPINQHIGQQVIISVTGGAPVLGIPLGGNIFQPVTGGPPVIGIPTSP